MRDIISSCACSPAHDISSMCPTLTLKLRKYGLEREMFPRYTGITSPWTSCRWRYTRPSCFKFRMNASTVPLATNVYLYEAKVNLNKAPRAPYFPSGSHPLLRLSLSWRRICCARVFRSNAWLLLVSYTRCAETFRQASSKGRLRTSPNKQACVQYCRWRISRSCAVCDVLAAWDCLNLDGAVRSLGLLGVSISEFSSDELEVLCGSSCTCMSAEPQLFLVFRDFLRRNTIGDRSNGWIRAWNAEGGRVSVFFLGGTCLKNCFVINDCLRGGLECSMSPRLAARFRV